MNRERSIEQAQEEIQPIGRMIRLKKGDSVLDIGCRSGRHSIALAMAGCQVVGIDLSESRIQKAKEDSNDLSVEFYRQDMRDIHLSSKFDAVLNVFSGFGSFETDTENMSVLVQIRKVLKSSGRFVIDAMNPDYVRRGFVPYTEREVNGEIVIEKRRIEEERLIKETIIQGEAEPRKYYESIRLYPLSWFMEASRKSGLSIKDIYGDYNRGSFNPLSSSRIILVGKTRLAVPWT